MTSLAVVGRRLRHVSSRWERLRVEGNKLEEVLSRRPCKANGRVRLKADRIAQSEVSTDSRFRMILSAHAIHLLARPSGVLVVCRL